MASNLETACKRVNLYFVIWLILSTHYCYYYSISGTVYLSDGWSP